ncbi:MAG: hypothetical protein DRG27_05130 [Deltaproteobacteria bacterium]|nr:MAG: hypothetical protein DRG27_05130 [Deltaproteobacteria bacterium]
MLTEVFSKTNYRVFYLDGKEGRPHKECEICKKINRNVIEPVAVFLPENKELKDLSPEELQNFNTCIFHCEKENEIWIENFEEYQKQKKDQTKKNDPNQFFQVEWSKNLFDEFWRACSKNT